MTKNIDVLIGVYAKIRSILESFEAFNAMGIRGVCTSVHGVPFKCILELFCKWQNSNLKCVLRLPHETKNGTIQIMYYPANGFHILIESQPCTDYKPNINLINYN